jgi:hypothetical protein
MGASFSWFCHDPKSVGPQELSLPWRSPACGAAQGAGSMTIESSLEEAANSRRCRAVCLAMGDADGSVELALQRRWLQSRFR